MLLAIVYWKLFDISNESKMLRKRTADGKPLCFLPAAAAFTSAVVTRAVTISYLMLTINGG